MGDQRFFIDHGVIHDRVTGKHVRTSGNVEDSGEDGIEECVRLLNSLAVDSTVCLKCRAPHDGTQWASCEHCSAARTKKLHELYTALEDEKAAGFSMSAELEDMRARTRLVEKRLRAAPVGSAREFLSGDSEDTHAACRLLLDLADAIDTVKCQLTEMR